MKGVKIVMTDTTRTPINQRRTMMNKFAVKPVALALMVAGLTPALLLTACNTGSNPTSSSSATQTNSASLNVSAAFPTGAGAALIDSGATSIEVSIQQGMNNPVVLNLTPQAPSGTATGLMEGPVKITITQKTGETVLETLTVPGELAMGTNNFTATMIRGAWTLTSAVTFNKTLSSSTERLDSVSLLPYTYQPQPGEKPMVNPYLTLLKGNNLPRCDKDTTTGDLINCTNTNSNTMAMMHYELGFSGKNAIRSYAGIGVEHDLPLAPDGDRMRRAMLVENFDPVDYFDEPGLYSEETLTATTSTGADVSQEVKAIPNTRPTAGNTIQGAFLEIEFISPPTETEVCHSDAARTQVITCPSNQPAPAKAKAVMKAIAAKSAGVHKSAPDANGCYLNLTVNSVEKDYDYRMDNVSQQEVIYYQTHTFNANLDACVHNFTATGTTLPQADIDAINTWGSANASIGVQKAR